MLHHRYLAQRQRDRYALGRQAIDKACLLPLDIAADLMEHAVANLFFDAFPDIYKKTNLQKMSRPTTTAFHRRGARLRRPVDPGRVLVGVDRRGGHHGRRPDDWNRAGVTVTDLYW